MNVKITGFRKRYADGFILHVDDLVVAAGQRLGMVGNNGAGKTTLLRSVLGLLRFSSGDILLDGGSVRSFDLAWRVRTASYVGESGLLPFLTPFEYWRFVGDAYGIERGEQRRRLEACHTFVDLPAGRAATRKYIRDYSQGARKKIGLTAALVARPGLLVLDEPFTNLDPQSPSILERMLIDVNEKHGTTLLVSSHDVVHLVNLSTRVLLLDDGRIAFDGESTPETLPFLTAHFSGGPAQRAAM